MGLGKTVGIVLFPLPERSLIGIASMHRSYVDAA